jgi:hypothetical protein
MQSESDPKPFYIRHNNDGTRNEYVLQDGWSEVLHRHVTPCVGADLIRDVQTWEADEFTARMFRRARHSPFRNLGKPFRKCGK